MPHTTTVSKTQDFKLPDSAVIFYNIVDASELKQQGCGIEAQGCAFGVGTNVVHIYVAGHTDDAVKHVLEHEFNHVIYGPEHNGR